MTAGNAKSSSEAATIADASLDDMRAENVRLRNLVRTLGQETERNAFVVELFAGRDGSLAIVLCAPQWADEESLARIVGTATRAALIAEKKLPEPEVKP